MENLSLNIDRERLIEYANSQQYFYSLDLSRISSLLITQLHYIADNRILNVFQVTDEIKSLEKGIKMSASKKEDEFRHKPLKGLMKKHFFDARYMSRNLANQNKIGMDINSMEKYIDAEVAKGKSINEIAHEYTMVSYETRASSSKLTGEWLVYSKYDSKNYYLTLATHDEGDEVIYDRIFAYCKNEYSFLPFFK